MGLAGRVGRGGEDPEVDLVVADIVLAQPPAQQLLRVLVEHHHLRTPRAVPLTERQIHARQMHCQT